MYGLENIISTTLAGRGLLPDGAPLLLMVSGGGDSVALAHLAAQGVLGDRPLRILHVNHLLRGADAERDERFVRDLAVRLGVEARVVRYSVAEYAEEAGLNLEDAGRRIRYRFADEELDGWCEGMAIPASFGRIAVAHTLDDRIETFFARAVTGSGSGGLGSIAPARGRIVRPLIDAERTAVRDWLQQAGETWMEDETNSDTSRQRSLIRHEILPAAEKLNPSFRASLARTMDLLADDDALLGEMAESFARDFVTVGEGEVSFAREMMCTLDRTMARRTVRVALARAFPDASRLEASHIEALVDGLTDDGFARDLPEGLRAHAEYDNMIVSRRDAPARSVAPSLLPVTGSVDLGSSGSIRAIEASVGDTSGEPDSVVIDGGKLCDELVVDSVRAGDRMRPLGMHGTRKLSDLMIDAKIPRRARGGVPVVRNGEDIVWLAGVRMSEDYRVTPATTKPLRLTWDRHGQPDGDGPSARPNGAG